MKPTPTGGPDIVFEVLLEDVGDFSSDKIYELHMPDGNTFRYYHGEMIPLRENGSRNNNPI
jgi:hypothetical protein